MDSSAQNGEQLGVLSTGEQALIRALRSGSPTEMGTAFAQVMMSQRAPVATTEVKPPPTPAAATPTKADFIERFLVNRVGLLEVIHLPVDGTPKHARMLRIVLADRWALDIVFWLDFWHITHFDGGK